MKIKELEKHYRGNLACSVKSLELLPGEKCAVVGASGAGKTTFLRLVNGLVEPDAGEITCSGTGDMRGVMVFQKPNLFAGTVEYNIAWGLKLRGMNPGGVRRRVLEAAKVVGMEKGLDWHVATLSAGEAQRVALARAMALRPQLLLLDEPTANLDPGNVTAIEKALVQGAMNHKVTILMVTHNLAQAKRIADTIAFFHNGKMQFKVNTNKFFTNRLTQEHAWFLKGEMVND